MAAREFGIEKKITNKQPDTQIKSPVFKNCISLQCFQQDVLEFDTITSIKGALDNFSLIPKFFSKKLRFFISLEVYTYVVTAC